MSSAKELIAMMTSNERRLREFLTTATEPVGWERVLINALLAVLDVQERGMEGKPSQRIWREDVIAAACKAIFGEDKP